MPVTSVPGTASAVARKSGATDRRSQALSTPVAGASMMAPLPTTAHVHMTAKKTLYVANPYGFSAQQRDGPLQELVGVLESNGQAEGAPDRRHTRGRGAGVLQLSPRAIRVRRNQRGQGV